MAFHATIERRKLEVFLAAMTAGFGLFLLLPSEAMASAGLAHLRHLASEAAWGGLFLTIGLAHCVWLAVNGARWWSPILRFWASFGSACLYLIWAAAIAQHDSASTAVYTYTGLALGAAACCVFAWRDAITSVRVHRAVCNYS